MLVRDCCLNTLQFLHHNQGRRDLEFVLFALRCGTFIPRMVNIPNAIARGDDDYIELKGR